MADLATATASRQTAVGGNTLDNETRAWNRYSEYCRSIGLGDNLFLEDMSRTHRIEIIGGFAVAVRQGRFSRPRNAPLAESTVSDTLNHVAAVFLQGKWTRRPKTGRRAQRCKTFTTATKIVQERRSKRRTTKSTPSLRTPPHSFLKIHRNSPSYGRTRKSRPSLGDALMRICKSSESRAKTNEAALHQEYCLHQRWKIRRPQVSFPSFSRLCFGHFQTTEKRQKGRYRHSVANFGRTPVPR